MAARFRPQSTVKFPEFCTNFVYKVKMTIMSGGDNQSKCCKELEKKAIEKITSEKTEIVRPMHFFNSLIPTIEACKKCGKKCKGLNYDKEMRLGYDEETRKKYHL